MDQKKAASPFEMFPRTWKRLRPLPRAVFVLALLSYFGGAFTFMAAMGGAFGNSRWAVAAPAIAITALALFLTGSLTALARRAADEKRFEAAEERVRENPEKTRYAWDLARIKLESYLDRNLNQVSSIFYLTAFVMSCGMLLIGIGVWRSLQDPNAIAPSILAAIAGIIIQIIGGTFLIIYRSTMDQAKNYVVVLERINAVGMSINILETIGDENAQARNEARADLARNLLEMYRPFSQA